MAGGRARGRLAGRPSQRRRGRGGRRDGRRHRVVRSGAVAGSTGAGPEGGDLPAASGTAGPHPEEAAREVPAVGHSLSPEPGGADGGDAGVVADSRSRRATGAVCVPAGPRRERRGHARASAAEDGPPGGGGRRPVGLLRPDSARGLAPVGRPARERRAAAGLGQVVAGDGGGGGRRSRRLPPDEPGPSGTEGHSAGVADFATVQQHLHASLHPGLEGAGLRPALRRGNRQLRGRLRGAGPCAGSGNAGRGRGADGAPEAADERREDPAAAGCRRSR